MEREEKLNASKQQQQTLTAFKSGITELHRQLPSMREELLKLRQEVATRAEAEASEASDKIQAFLSQALQALLTERSAREKLEAATEASMNKLKSGGFWNTVLFCLSLLVSKKHHVICCRARAQERAAGGRKRDDPEARTRFEGGERGFRERAGETSRVGRDA